MFYGGTSWREGSHLHAEPLGEGTPQFRSISIRDVSCRGARRAIEMRGLPEMPIEGVELEGVCIQAERGAILQHVRGVSLRDVRLEVAHLPALECLQVLGLSTERFDGTLGESCGKEAHLAGHNGHGASGPIVVEQH